jgi:pimeloyl-ACP methyl ester carboxylesterase
MTRFRPTVRPFPPSRPGWLVAKVAGHPCEIHAPADPLPGRAVVYLHGVRERWLQELPVLRDLIEAARLPVLAPRAGRSWWLDKIVPGFDPAVTAERYVIGPVVAEVARRFGVVPPGIAVVGTSMGGQGALRLAYRHPNLLPVAAAISPAIDFHAAMREAHERSDGELYDTLWEIYGDVERARQDTAILHVHPLNWPRHQFFACDPADTHWYDGAVRLQSKLVALGIPHTAILEPRGGGHGQEYDDRVSPDVMRFVLERLDQESRRIA